MDLETLSLAKNDHQAPNSSCSATVMVAACGEQRAASVKGKSVNGEPVVLAIKDPKTD